MATTREYFEKDCSQNLRVHDLVNVTDSRTGQKVEITAAMSLDFEAGSKYGVIYIPSSPMVSSAIAHYIANINELIKVADGALVNMGLSGTDENLSSLELKFSGRLIVYTPYIFSINEKLELQTLAASNGIGLVLRDGSYTAARSGHEKPLAFISHDSRDKDVLVRELASTLQKMLCPVWYDEYSLIAGQSLRESIEKGLRECKKCVLVLSPSFLANGGWTKAEFDSIFTREIMEKQNVIVPVWHNVSKEEIYQYSPRLVDKVGISSTLGIEEVARRILRAVNHEV
ncbi:MAG: toll/interleukin-1 receptor domain-containing protein [Methylotenera sp.]|uniref:toll/interleukin-1 receptor domain-containing protein n=1 Tax=Methylotenera sp. TaxID=2051956 RepID=UPI00179D910E|nr:toll/interleukin-1 receptor domain-containing protein [Methylotenera sp.]NOU24803.1 toll/interleukin-1 receptor domain-containing protein [Methylotenera sp.]